MTLLAWDTMPLRPDENPASRALSECRNFAGAAGATLVSRRLHMKELIRYLLENMYFDFQGEISLEQVRLYLREDDTRDSKQLLQKLIEDKGIDDLLISLADGAEGPHPERRQ